MPNLRRTFPGKSLPSNDDDDGRNNNFHPGSGGTGGKQFGKSLRPPTEDDVDVEDDDDSDDDDDDDDQDGVNPKPQQHVAVRGAGKHLSTGSGKYLRPTYDDGDDDDDEDLDDDDEDEAPVVKIQPRPGGKNILRMRQPNDDEDDDDDDDEDDDEEEDDKPDPPISYRVQGRGGGKSLARMAQPPVADDDDEDDDEDEDDDDDEIVVEKVVTSPLPPGKSIRRPPAVSSVSSTTGTAVVPTSGAQQHVHKPPEAPSKPVSTSTSISRGPSGGKVLRRPTGDEDDDDDEKTAGTSILHNVSGGKVLRRTPEIDNVTPNVISISRGPEGGKLLRRQQDDDDKGKSSMDQKVVPISEIKASIVGRSPHGGKVLRPPEPDPAVKAGAETVVKPKTTTIGRSPAGGKVLRRAKDDDEDDKPAPKQTISRASTGGKRLNRKIEEASDDDDDNEDDMLLDDDDDEDDDDFEDKSPPAKRGGRPKRAAAVKAAAKSKIDVDVIGDDDVSSDDDEELDISNTEALIKDEADRKYLDSLPELEREAILGERFDKLKEKQDMLKAIAEARRNEGKGAVAEEPKNKKKLTDKKEGKQKKLKTDKDEELARKLASTRSSSRSKDVSGAKSKKAAALAALKRQRKIQQDMEESSSDGSEIDFGDDDEDSDEDYEESGLKPWQKKSKAEEKVAVKSSKISRLDGDDGVDDSDMDTDDDDRTSGKRIKLDATSGTDAGLDDFAKVTIPRRRLARWCNEPFFDAAVLECFVRLFIGEDDKGEKVYRLCEIVDVKTDKRSYKFPIIDKNEKPVSTNKILRLKFGTNERDFPMNLISDTPPTIVDVQKYLTTQKNNRLECLSKRRATKLRRTQDHLVSNYTYTTEDIERNLQQRKMEGKFASNLGSAQTKISLAVQGAKDALVDAERQLTDSKKALMEFSGALHEENELEKAVEVCTKSVEDAKKHLEDLLNEEKAMVNAIKNRTMKLTGRERDQNWAKVNQRALQLNQKVDRESYKVQKEIDARKAAGEKEKFNPYARRKVKPKILWEVGQASNDHDDDETNVEEAKDHSQSVPTSKGMVLSDTITPALVPDLDRTNNNTSTLPATLLISESHQFVIDEEGLAAAASSSSSQQVSSVHTNTSTRTIHDGSQHTSITTRVRKGISLTEYFDRKEKGIL